MTAPVAASARVPLRIEIDVPGWTGTRLYSHRDIGDYQMEVARAGDAPVWRLKIRYRDATILRVDDIRANPGEAYIDAANRIRRTVDAALEQHLLAALGALRGEPVETP